MTKANNEQIWFLESLDLRSVFCPQKLGGLGFDMTHLHYEPSQYIYLPDEPAQKVYLINEGRIKIGTYGEEGKEVTKAVLCAGEVFGELAIIGQEQRRDFAYVIEPTVLCVLERDDLGNLLRERSELQLFFMRLIGNRTLRLERRLENLMFKTSRCRIVEFLHELATDRGRPVGFEREVRSMLTHREIADLTGTSRQTVNTVLNELRREGVLTFNRKRMLVRDMDALASSA